MVYRMRLTYIGVLDRKKTKYASATTTIITLSAGILEKTVT